MTNTSTTGVDWKARAEALEEALTKMAEAILGLAVKTGEMDRFSRKAVESACNAYKGFIDIHGNGTCCPPPIMHSEAMRAALVAALNSRSRGTGEAQ